MTSPQPADYFGFVWAPELESDPVERKAPVMRDRTDWTSGRPSDPDELCAAVLDALAVAVFSDVDGALSLRDPFGASASGDPSCECSASGADDDGAGGVLSVGSAESADGGALLLGPVCGALLGAAGLSTFPKMMGRPSLPVPITTIFALGDCAS
jgi:hypothetical protein